MAKDAHACLPASTAYDSGMGTKQHSTFCPSCGKTTKHVTRYHKDDGGPLFAIVRCVEHTESALSN